MKNLVAETPEQIDQLIKKGFSIYLLDKIQAVISSQEISSERKLVYQLLKCQALTSINLHDQALELLNEIRNEVFEKGNDVQKLDCLIFKADNFEVLSRLNESLALLEEAEQILQKSQINDTKEMQKRKVNLLIQRIKTITATKRYFEYYDPKSFDKIVKLFDQCINLSKKLRYNYGIGYSLGLKGWYLIWEGKFNEALECFEEAYIVYERDKNRGGIARTIARKGVS
ncbi:MAG: hypothetical protein ACXAAM_06895, partial [Candidatus Heimdallarchaeaceae archaeon]